MAEHDHRQAQELGVDQLRQKLVSLEDPAATEEYRQRVNEHIAEYRQIRSNYRQRHGVSTITDDFEGLFDRPALSVLHNLMLKSFETRSAYKTYQKRLTRRSPWHLSLSDFVFHIAAYDASKDFLCRLHAFSKVAGNSDVNKALPEVLRRRQLRLDPNTTSQTLRTRRVLRRQAWVPQDVLLTAPSNANASSDSEEDDDDELDVEHGRKEHVSTIRGDDDFNAPSDSFCQASPSAKRRAESTPASPPSRKRRRSTPGPSALWRDVAAPESTPGTVFAPLGDDSILAVSQIATGTPSPAARYSLGASVDDSTFQLLPASDNENDPAAPAGARETANRKDGIKSQATLNDESEATARSETPSRKQRLADCQMTPGSTRENAAALSAPAIQKEQAHVALLPKEDGRGAVKLNAPSFTQRPVRNQLSPIFEQEASPTSRSLVTEKKRVHTMLSPEPKREAVATQSSADLTKKQAKVPDGPGSQEDTPASADVNDDLTGHPGVQAGESIPPVQAPQTQSAAVSQPLFPAGATSGLSRFLPGQWLSDNCIFFAHDAAHGLCQNKNAAIRLLAGGVDTTKPKHKLRLTLKASNKQIAFPVHLPDHWAFGLFDISNKTVQFFDSLGTRYRTHCWDAFREQIVFQSPKSRTEILLPGERTLEPEPPKNLARQDDTASCGVFACVYGLALSKGQPIPSTLDVPLWRWVLSLLVSQSQSWPMLPMSDFGLDQMTAAISTMPPTAGQKDNDLFALATREAKSFEAGARSLQRVLDRLTALQQAQQLLGIDGSDRRHQNQKEQHAWYKKLVEHLQSAPAGVETAEDLVRAVARLQASEEDINSTEQRIQFLEPVARQLAALETSLKQQREQMELAVNTRQSRLRETKRVVSDALDVKYA